MSAFEVLKCDGCGDAWRWERTGGRATNWEVLRKNLERTADWHSTKRKGKPARDFCPTCWKLGKR